MLEQPYKYHTSIPGYNIKETKEPVLLNESIFSKEYTFQSLSTLSLDDFGEGDNNNVFTNAELDDRTTSSSTLTTNTSNCLFFVSGGSSHQILRWILKLEILFVSITLKMSYTIESNGFTITDQVEYYSYC